MEVDRGDWMAPNIAPLRSDLLKELRRHRVVLMWWKSLVVGWVVKG